MIEANPYRQIARVIALIAYIIAGTSLFVGVFLGLFAVATDISHLPGMTQGRFKLMVVSWFTVLAIMSLLIGWRIQRVFGQRIRPVKPVYRAVIGGLRLGSLGCVLWTVPGFLGIIFSGQILSTGEPAGTQDLFVMGSMILGVNAIMLVIAWFLSVTFIRLSDQDRRSVYEAYLELVRKELPYVAAPETRSHLQEQTIGLLPKLNETLKGALLHDLSKLNLLTGGTRIVLRNVDFRGADLCLSDLPRADLRGINLEQARLEAAHLSGVNLSGAKLKGCNLSRARLQEANLQQADLTDALLSEAKLRAANLSGTTLKRANLSEADLQSANLQGANLRDANLSYAKLEGALLDDATLDGANLTGTILTNQ